MTKWGEQACRFHCKLIAGRFLLATAFVGLLWSPSFAQSSQDSVNLDQLNQQLENPLSRFWSLILQDNINWKTGSAVSEDFTTNVLFFQPSLPVPIAKGRMLLVRPVFPIVTAPRIDAAGDITRHTTGFGDIQVFSLYGPDKKGGLIWGAGLTFIFPTASSPELGEGKYQMGPAFMLLSITKKYTSGTIIQYWNDIGGDPSRPATRRMDIQYIIRRQILGAGMSIGMGPTILIDFTAPEGDRVTFPIGLGFTKTSLIGRMPLKWRIEPQYTLVRPNSLGTKWTLRLQAAPVIRSPFLQ